MVPIVMSRQLRSSPMQNIHPPAIINIIPNTIILSRFKLLLLFIRRCKKRVKGNLSLK